MPSSRVSPATNRDATVRPSLVPVATRRNQGCEVTQPTSARNAEPLTESSVRPCGPSIGVGGSAGGDAPAEHLEELADPDLATFGAVGLAVDQAGVELLGAESILEAFGHPVEHRGKHLDVDVVADLTSTHPELHELERPVRVLAAHEPADRAAETKPRVVAADHRDPVRHPFLGQELLRPSEPVLENGPESLLDDLPRCVQPRRQHADGPLVCGEKQALLVAEVQEDRPLGHADLRRDVLDASAAVAVLCEVPHGHIQDEIALCLSVSCGGVLDVHDRAQTYRPAPARTSYIRKPRATTATVRATRDRP